jgi:hypothetical protein
MLLDPAWVRKTQGQLSDWHSSHPPTDNLSGPAVDSVWSVECYLGREAVSCVSKNAG